MISLSLCAWLVAIAFQMVKTWSGTKGLWFMFSDLLVLGLCSCAVWYTLLVINGGM